MKKRLRTSLAALAFAVATLPWHGLSASADAPTPDLATLNQQLTADQDRLNVLNNEVEVGQANLDTLNRKLVVDQQSEVQLDKDLTMMGRVEYEQPSLNLSTILSATSLQQLLSDIAQARVVAHRQQNVLAQAHRLRQADQQARDAVAVNLAQVQAARDEAAQIAMQTLSLRNSVQDAALRTRAGQLAAQAMATGAAAPAVSVVGRGPSGSATNPNRFAFGYCTWFVATQVYIPWLGNAIDWWPNARAYNYAEGQTPRVGSVMVTEESGWGHVALVVAVNANGSWTVREMNYTAWDVVDQRTIAPGQVPLRGFIYIP